MDLFKGIEVKPEQLTKRGRKASGEDGDELENIVKILTKATAGFDGVADRWSPDRRWSSGRVRFTTEAAMWSWILAMRENQTTTYKIGTTTFSIWAAKETNRPDFHHTFDLPW